MTDELQEPSKEPVVESVVKAENLVDEPNAISPTSKRSNKNLWIIAGITIALICICSIICLALIGTGVGKVMVERAPVEAVLDSFMNYMEAKDVESAYALFSPRVQRQIPIDDVQEMIEGNNYVLFDGYQSLSVQNINLTAVAKHKSRFAARNCGER